MFAEEFCGSLLDLLPQGRIDTLLQTFHAVLDARTEEKAVLAFSVLAVGGVKVSPRSRRVRIREDGATVEAEATGRTFSCPICDARVPFSADRCPSCHTPRSEMGLKAQQPGLMNYLESLQGKEVGAPGRVAPRPPEDRTRGLTNGVRPAEAPPGRVNGTSGAA